MFENSAIDTTFFLNSKKYSWLPKMLHFHVHNKVSLKAEHIDLSKPLFITLKVCINFRFSNLNLAQCWLWPATQHSVLRRKATLIFVSKILQWQKIEGFSINSVWTLEKISKSLWFKNLSCLHQGSCGPPPWHPSHPGPRPHKCLQSCF